MKMTAKRASRTATRTSDVAPQRVQEAPARRPRISLVGSDELLVRRVARRLDHLRVNVVTQSWNELLDTLQAELAALVIVEPILGVANATAVEIVREHPNGTTVPIFFVVPDATSSRAVRGLYRAGVSTVFNWPRDSKILPTLFAEAYGIVQVRGRSGHADKALARSVRAHLRAALGRGVPGLRLVVSDGLVSVSGQVDTLARRWEILETIAVVPGVRAVIAESLRVRSAAIPNRVLSRRIRNLIDHTVDLDSATLAVGTDNGQVALSGVAADRAELQRLEELISNLKGVRTLESNVSISPGSQHRDSHVARRIMTFLTNLYPEERLSLAVFDGIAVISGHVCRLSMKRSIERFLRRDRDVHRVVNKLEVRSRRRP